MAGSTTTAERGARKPGGTSSARPSRPGRPAGGRTRLPSGRTILVTLAALVLLAAGIWVLYGSQWLRVRDVPVTGTRVLTPAQVKATAAVPLGAPLVSVDTDAIEDRLLRSLPRIDSVAVERSWPNGIALNVTERRPVLLLEKGEKFLEVDAKGVRYATVDRAPKGVPLLRLTVDQSPSLRRFDVERLTREAVGVAGVLPAPVARDTRIVGVRSYDSITLELTGGRTVVWGSGEDGEAKARALTALMKAAPKAGHFDVSAPTAPAASRS
ncbi:FtsQ-type POTRA domain-containing protein [Streptomyces sp. NPDC006368]|uniref:cell division protein FtsQ/DivIB n=1 Tax=Streptomyces sp. NPDC006368 TaxID=3156760 RepID=UPI00339F6ABD